MLSRHLSNGKDLQYHLLYTTYKLTIICMKQLSNKPLPLNKPCSLNFEYSGSGCCSGALVRRPTRYRKSRSTWKISTAHTGPVTSTGWALDRAEGVRRFHHNCSRRHSALKLGKEIRTPAMRAGLTTRRLRFRDISSLRLVQVAPSQIVYVFADLPPSRPRAA